MPRYIDAEKLDKDGWSASRTYQQDAKTMVYETKKMTDFLTVDVQEVKRGKWTHDGSKWANRFICSECGYKLFDEPTNFCPDCGADMRERREDGDCRENSCGCFASHPFHPVGG